jgi:adenylate cyclase
LIKTFEDGLDHYYLQNWEKALALFKKSESMEDHFSGRNTTPSNVYIDRCIMFKESPPGKDWNGVWTMTSK